MSLNYEILKIDDICYETYPCQHYVTIKINGEISNCLWSMVKIYEQCKKQGFPIPQHIESEYSNLIKFNYKD